MPTPRLLLPCILATLAFTVAARADDGAAKPEPLKNIQILKGASRDDVNLAMKVMSGALGVDCGHCHVQVQNAPWPMEKDDKQTKRVARKMMTMTAKINHDFFGGDAVVSCVTCHKGQREPAETLPLETVFTAHEPQVEDDRPPTVTLADVLARWTQALGGRAALEKLRTRVAKGRVLFGPNMEMPLEVSIVAPDRYLAKLTTPNGTMTEGLDGKDMWIAGGFGVQSMSTWDRADAAREAQLRAPLELNPAALRQLPDATVGKNMAHVLELKANGCVERLYFDGKSGLLVRRVVHMPTRVGDLVQQIDYEDWKSVDGVMVAFTIKRNSMGEVQMERYGIIQNNVPVDAKAFARPVK